MENQLNLRPSSYADLWAGFQQMMETYVKTHIDTVQPVEIVEVLENGFVNVKPIYQNTTTSGEVLPNTALYTNIPVLMMYGAGNKLSFKVGVGNQGLLVACKYDISTYKETKQEAPLPSYRTYNWANGFYLPITFGNTNEGFIIQQGANKIEVLESSINITASGGVNITGDTTITGAVTISGAITAQSTITASGEITSGAIGLTTHKHGGVTPGNGQTTPPV